MGYRNRQYRSVLTGTLAPALRAPWMEIMDDSLESFQTNHMRAPAPAVLRKTA